MSVARPVRVTRPSSSARPARTKGPSLLPTPGGEPTVERRKNAAASRRAVRLSVLFAGGIGAVYAALVLLAGFGPSAGSSGSVQALLIAGIVAVLVAAAGVVVSLGAAPRAIELGEDATIVVGRFGRRYRYPGRARLTTTVLQKVPVGWLTPVPLESVEIAGGSARRSFLLEEGLLKPRNPAERAPG